MFFFQGQPMTRKIILCLLALISVLPGWTALAANPTGQAANLLHEALRQMGGEDKLKALHAVRFHGRGYRNMLEQSERPEGPYIVEYQDVSQWRDLDHARWKQETELSWEIQPSVKLTIVASDGAVFQDFGGQPFPASAARLQQAEEELELGPERVLLTALNAADVHLESDTVLQSVPNHVLSFTWKGSPARVFLNAYTSQPTAVEWTRAYPSDTFWSTWGDVTTRIYYSFWWLLPGGIHYPKQWDVLDRKSTRLNSSHMSIS